MLTVLLGDDDPSTRTVLRLRLELEADITVISTSDPGIEIAARVKAIAPDVVILDVSTPIPDIASAVALLGTFATHAGVVVLSLYDDATTRASLLAAGAVAVVSKHGPDDLLLAAVRAAATHSSPGPSGH